MSTIIFSNITMFYHITELRLRFTYLLLSYIFAFLVCYFYSLEIIYLFVRPLLTYHQNFIFTDLTEAFYTTINMCALASLIVVLPYFFYQIWCFFIPSCFLSERRLFTYIWYIIILLFILGISILYFILLPQLYNFLINFEIKSDWVNVQLQARIQSYVSLVWRFFFISSVLSQLPIICFLLYKLQILSTYILPENRRFILFFCTILSAFLAPPDVYSQLLITFSLLFTFELMIWLIFFFTKITPITVKNRIRF